MYVDTSVARVDGTLDENTLTRASTAAAESGALLLALLPGRGPPQNAWLAHLLPAAKNVVPAWAGFARLHTVKEYGLPNGRRYVLLEASARIRQAPRN
jgi:hypothetical protein